LLVVGAVRRALRCSIASPYREVPSSPRRRGQPRTRKSYEQKTALSEIFGLKILILERFYSRSFFFQIVTIRYRREAPFARILCFVGGS